MMEQNQDKIWRHFQNEGSRSFLASHPRLRYLVKRAQGGRSAIGKRLLNIGVGDGYLESIAIQRGFEVFSLDPDAEAIGRVTQMGSRGSIGVIESMPFEASFFDVVIASEVLEHLSSSQRSMGLAEIARILSPGGQLIGTTPYNEDLSLGDTVCPCCGKLFHRWGHQATFTLATMRSELEPHFRVKQLTCTAFPSFQHSKSLWVKPLLRIALAKLGQQIASPTIFFVALKR